MPGTEGIFCLHWSDDWHTAKLQSIFFLIIFKEQEKKQDLHLMSALIEIKDHHLYLCLRKMY